VAVDDGAVIAGRQEPGEELDVLLRVLRDADLGLPVAHPPGQEDQEGEVQHEAQVGVDEDAAAVERAARSAEGVLADRVEDRVVALAALREVVAGAIDDLIRAERADQLDGPGAADGGDVRTHALRQLDAGGADRAGRPVDKDAPPGLDVRLAEAGEGQGGAIGHGCSLVEADAIGHERHRRALLDRQVLGIRAGPGGAEDAIADLELGDGWADLRDLAGELDARDPILRPQQAGEQAAGREVGAAMARIRAVDGGSMDAHEHLVVRTRRPRHLIEAQDLWRPVSVEDDSPHEVRTVPAAAPAGRPPVHGDLRCTGLQLGENK
jgi:hypothetical protein